MVVLFNAGGIVDVSNAESFVSAVSTAAPDAAPAIVLSGVPTQICSALSFSDMASQSASLVDKTADDNGRAYRVAIAAGGAEVRIAESCDGHRAFRSGSGHECFGEGPVALAIAFCTAGVATDPNDRPRHHE
ncbi:hypothetical protein SAMN07250955_105103 [Arboricoccus pini]|uniref:Uncharacterized protein n=1 Tax=Arboricoccus pini TaxID=1963835 RepID=A0A212R359_9PROT|nr:hypothetical protein [Arboricoccus pini]SNB66427.1 hypothetical protein SAMN07250955_105103 [Arboricoccus pini]